MYIFEHNSSARNKFTRQETFGEGKRPDDKESLLERKSHSTRQTQKKNSLRIVGRASHCNIPVYYKRSSYFVGITFKTNATPPTPTSNEQRFASWKTIHDDKVYTQGQVGIQNLPSSSHTRVKPGKTSTRFPQYVRFSLLFVENLIYYQKIPLHYNSHVNLHKR